MNAINQVAIKEDTDTIITENYGSAYQSLAVSLARAEVDQQVATARALPRSIDKAIRNILSLATLDDESAVECIYALPRGGTPIKGPSIRMAEIIASQWGNNRNGARVVHVDKVEQYVEAEGVFHDLESNTATTSRVRRRISTKYGKLLSDDMIIITGNATCAIAKRNAILGGVPKAVWRKAYSAVEKVIAGDAKTLVERRAGAMKAFAAFGVKPEQIFAALEVAGMDDISGDHLVTMLGMHSALKSGEETVETMFKRVAPTVPPAPVVPPVPAAKLAETVDADTGEILDEIELGPSDAYEAGRQARKAGKSVHSVPDIWRDGHNEPMADAWKSGWEREDEMTGAK